MRRHSTNGGLVMPKDAVCRRCNHRLSQFNHSNICNACQMSDDRPLPETSAAIANSRKNRSVGAKRRLKIPQTNRANRASGGE